MQNNTFSALFVGQNIVSLKRIDSTNDYLKKEVANSKPLAEGTVILAEDQYAGRGQFDNKWTSQAGKNLTFSILLSPSFLQPTQQFSLNIAVSLAINDVLCTFIGEECKIKWPNDVIFREHKLGGVLIENIVRGNQWKHAIVGIGINVNQQSFPESIRKITSLSMISNTDFDLTDILAQLCEAIGKRYDQLRKGDIDLLRREYRSKLYHLDVPSLFEHDGKILTGRITGVTESGLLELETEAGLKHFGLKELKYIA